MQNLKKRILKDFLSDTVHAESHFFQAYEQICLYIAFKMRYAKRVAGIVRGSQHSVARRTGYPRAARLATTNI